MQTHTPRWMYLTFKRGVHWHHVACDEWVWRIVFDIEAFWNKKKKKKRLILCCSIALFVSYNQRTKCGTSVSFDLTTHSKNMSSSIQMRSCDRALTGGIEQALRVVIGAHLASGRGYADVGANTCLPRWVLGFCCGLKQKSRIHRAIRKWSVNVVCHINVVEIWCANKI